MVSCPMCGKVYSEHELELHAQAEKVGAHYCCPHCGWAWDPAFSNKPDQAEDSESQSPAANKAKKTVKSAAKKTAKTSEDPAAQKPAKASKAKTEKAAPKKTTKVGKPKTEKAAKPKAE
ncbi:hypothetical protein FAI41_03570 [Acetobacteraceae bacterium]|nr:hypothetical protein FAI41_03570 [Acetobacteraceae bacterium]